jgi:hypothetical protein
MQDEACAPVAKRQDMAAGKSIRLNLARGWMCKMVIRNSKHELHGVESSSEAAPRRRGFTAQMNVIDSQRTSKNQWPVNSCMLL